MSQLGRSNIGVDARRLRALLGAAGGVPSSPVDHGSLTGLGDDDHSQYVHISAGRTITGQHQFAPAVPQPPFTLGANAQGQTVVGLRADQLNKSVLPGSGLAGGGVLTADVTLNLNTPGTLSASSGNTAAGNHTHAVTASADPGAAESLLKTTSAGLLTLTGLAIGESIPAANKIMLPDGGMIGGGGNVIINPAGDIVFDPAGNDVLPQTDYDINLGAINKKYLTLHAAELWVQTLVAQNVLATIGGRILVGPTTELTSEPYSTGGGTSYYDITHRGTQTGTTANGTSVTVNVPSGTATNEVMVAMITAGAVSGGSVPTVGNTATGFTSNGTTVVVNKPSGVVDNDLLIAVIGHDTNTTPSVTPPAGWTAIRNDVDSGTNGGIWSYYKVAASEGASYTFTAGSSGRLVGHILQITGFDATTPIDASNGQVNSAATSVVAPSVTTLVDNTLLLFLGAINATATFTPPSGMTEITDSNTTNMAVETASGTVATAGSTGTRTATASTSAVNYAQLVAIRPGAARGTTAVTITPTAGWTTIRTDTNGGLRQAAYYRVAGSEPGNYQWTTSGNATIAGRISTYQQVDTTTPVEANSGQTNSSSGSITATSLTTLTNKAQLVGGYGIWNNQVLTAPGGTTERGDIASTTGSISVSQLSSDEQIPTAGATGSRVASGETAENNIGQLLALRPGSYSSGVTWHVEVKHNQFQNGDIVYLEADGKIEFMQVDSAASGSGPYSYDVLRNLDGTGENNWYAGDAVFNTGQAGNGFIDIYSTRGVNAPPVDYIFNYDNGAGAYSSNYAGVATWSPFGNNANTGNQDGIYFGVVGTTWANLYFNLTTAAAYTATLQWQYWNGSAWTNFSPTATDFKSTGTLGVTWSAASLSGWAATTVNGASAYWVRVIISAFTSWTTLPVQSGRVVNRLTSQYGPTIVGNVRNSKTVFNDWGERWAIGNLNGLYGYGADTYGAAFGKYAAGNSWIAIDPTNGIRILNGTTTVVGQWSPAGVITVGQVASGQSNIQLSAGAVKLRNNTTDVITLLAAANGTGQIATFDGAIGLSSNGGIYQGTGTVSSPTTGLKIWNEGGVGRIAGYNGGTAQWYADTDGTLRAGGGRIVLDANGLYLRAGSGGAFGSGRHIIWETSGGTDLLKMGLLDDLSAGEIDSVGGPFSINGVSSITLQPAENLHLNPSTYTKVSGDIRSNGGLVLGSQDVDPAANTLVFIETGSTPGSPPAGTQANLYVKGDKLVVQFNDAGTTRYKYLDLTGTGITWVHTTTAP